MQWIKVKTTDGFISVIPISEIRVFSYNEGENIYFGFATRHTVFTTLIEGENALNKVMNFETQLLKGKNLDFGDLEFDFQKGEDLND